MNASPEILPVAINNCYHCGGELPSPAPYSENLKGQLRYFCCAGCLAIAQTIHGQGLDAFYSRRIPLGGKPEDLKALSHQVPDQLLAYDDPLLLDRFTRPVESHGQVTNKLETTLRLEKIRCAACVWLNEQHLKRIPGVTDVQINYVTQRLLFSLIQHACHFLKFCMRLSRLVMRHGHLSHLWLQMFLRKNVGSY